MTTAEIFHFGDEQSTRAWVTVHGVGWIGRLKRVVDERVIIALYDGGTVETTKGALCVVNEAYVDEACRGRGNDLGEKTAGELLEAVSKPS